MTEALLLVTLGVAILYPDVLTLFSVLGGLIGGIIVLVVPSKYYLALLRIKACGHEGWKKYGLLTFFGIIFLMGTTGAVLSVLGLA